MSEATLPDLGASAQMAADKRLPNMLDEIHMDWAQCPALARQIGSPPMAGSDDAYLAREARARKQIDKQLKAAGWVVQGKDEIDVNAGPGVATREFPLEKPHG